MTHAPRSVLALLTPLLLLGCKQSLFDETVGDDDIDASIGGQPDASIGGQPDAGPPDANDPLAPDGGPDAGAECGLPCLGDAVGEWNGTQGGTMGRFHYRDYRRLPGHDAADMQLGTFSGVQGFVGRGTPKAAIGGCGDLPGFAGCAGLGNALLVAPGQVTGDGYDPALEYTSSVGGVLRVHGQFSTATGATGGRQHLFMSRNTRPDKLFDGTFRPGDPLGTFDFEVDTLPGDRFALLVAPPLDGTATPLGVQLYVNELAAAPNRCQLGVDFENPPTDRCHDMALTRLSTDTPAVLSTTVPSFSTEMGKAEHFVSGSYLRGSTPADYSKDFTIQFWMKVAEPPEFQSAVYADWGCEEQGGVNIAPDDDGKLYVAGFWKDNTIDYCTSSNPAPVLASGTRPTDGGWHFYRIVRSTTDAKLRICIDGALRGDTLVPAAKDMTSGNAPHIGRNVVYNPAYFAGDVDDFRILSRALPCN